jgi:inorganic pyrophosphatase
VITKQYWQSLDELIALSEIVIDRPANKAHPRYPDMIYPLDYGYLKDTCSADNNEIDCWVGSLQDRRVTAVVFTVDLVKRDMEVKLLLGCTAMEMQQILAFQNTGPMSALLLERSEDNE